MTGMNLPMPIRSPLLCILLAGALLGSVLVGLQGRAAAAEEPRSPAYRVVGRIPLPGAVRWDYLTFDSARSRLFISRGETVDVLDVRTGQQVGTIPGTQGVHGVALAPGLNLGFTSNGASNSVTVFDLTTLQPTGTVATGAKPDAIVYDPFSHRVLAADGKGDHVTVIDAQTRTAAGRVELPGAPESAVVDGLGTYYVNIEDRSLLVAVDTKTLTVKATYDLAPGGCEGPTGLAIDAAKQRLFTTCSNKVMLVIDGPSGRIVASLPIGAGSDAAVFDSGSHLAFSSNRDGTLTVVTEASPDHYRVLDTVQTLPGARTVALDPTTHRLYLATAEVDDSGPQPTNGRPRWKPGSFMILTVAPQGS
jgi:hypothetical protein